VEASDWTLEAHRELWAPDLPPSVKVRVVDEDASFTDFNCMRVTRHETHRFVIKLEHHQVAVVSTDKQAPPHAICVPFRLEGSDSTHVAKWLAPLDGKHLSFRGILDHLCVVYDPVHAHDATV
jgi:hypothetical protein